MEGMVFVEKSAAMYFAWNRAEETSAPLAVIEDRFPALFESRRLLYPALQDLAAPNVVEQGISGFMDQVLTKNFVAFAEHLAVESGQPVVRHERADSQGRETLLDSQWMAVADTLVIVSFDSLRTEQRPSKEELDAVSAFLAQPGNLLIVSPHHDIGHTGADVPDAEQAQVRETEFYHHGDRTIPPRQGFGGFARSLLAGLGVPVENRFGLRPAVTADGSPMPIEREQGLDRLGLLGGVLTFNAHPHLPHLHRMDGAKDKMDVLARQLIDKSAPPHEFTAGGRTTFDAMLQSRAGVFGGNLLITDATLWSSTAGGLDSLRRLWTNVVHRSRSPG